MGSCSSSGGSVNYKKIVPTCSMGAQGDHRVVYHLHQNVSWIVKSRDAREAHIVKAPIVTVAGLGSNLGVIIL